VLFLGAGASVAAPTRLPAFPSLASGVLGGIGWRYRNGYWRKTGFPAFADPGLTRYDLTVVLGGTVTANELHTRLALSLADEGAELGTVVALTADRPLTDAETTRTGCLTESQHLTAELGDAFGAGPPDVQIVIAQPSVIGQRANTTDAIGELIRRMPGRRRRHVLAITSAIYVPYQFFVIALR
jgi:hypothetical protein